MDFRPGPWLIVKRPSRNGAAGERRIEMTKRTKKAAKKNGTAKAKSTGKKASTPKVTKEAKPKRVSAIDAAAQLLRKRGEPMKARDLIAAMSEQGLWSSPKGKTPHATLYAAMLREISAKGGKARFKKVDRGLFAFNG